MTERFVVEARSPLFLGLDDVGVVFHGINKSGSLAMATVLREALIHAGRKDEVLSHYHMPPAPSLEVYRALLEARKGRYFAVAHYLYGFLGPAPRRLWITQFRHPLPRLVSVHQWIKNKHVKAHGSAEGFPDLASFVRRGRGLAHSQVAQFGAGFGRFEKSAAKLSLPPSTLFELSVEAIERDVSLIGIAERFEESIFAFAGLLGLPSVAPWATDTRNPGRPLVDELAPAEREAIQEVYAWDFALYDWALERFAAQNARIAFGPELERYKAACEGAYKDRLLVEPAPRPLVPQARAAVEESAARDGPAPDGAPAPDAGPALPPHEEIARLRAETAALHSSSRLEAGLRDELAARDAQIARLNRELAAHQAQGAEIRRLSSALATEDARHAALTAEVARLTGEVARIRAAADARLARVTARLDRARRAHEAENARLRTELAAYAQSWSWRLTTPLRALATQARLGKTK